MACVRKRSLYNRKNKQERMVSMADKKQNPLKYGEIISKCWEDEAYRKRFLEDPESVFAEVGYVTEEGVTYKVIEQPKLVRYIVIPHENVKESVQIVTKHLLNLAEKKDVIIPEGAEARIIQNTEDIRYLILPASPKTLTKEELSMAAGGDAQVVQVVGSVVEVTTASVVATAVDTTTEVSCVCPTYTCVMTGPTALVAVLI